MASNIVARWERYQLKNERGTRERKNKLTAQKEWEWEKKILH